MEAMCAIALFAFALLFFNGAQHPAKQQWCLSANVSKFLVSLFLLSVECMMQSQGLVILRRVHNNNNKSSLYSWSPLINLLKQP